MKNIERFIEYFSEGCKNEFKIGLEIEHFIVKKDTLESVPYYGERGVKEILEELETHFEESIYEQEELIGLSNEFAYITLEPGSQLELSIKSCNYIWQIEEIYGWFYSRIQPILERYSYTMYYGGYLPKNKAGQIPLIPKQRYEYMDRYFEKTGIYGKDMMRGTASCQISIDYKEEEDFILKYRVACLLVPIVYLITDNTTNFKLPCDKNYAGRAEIWNGVDEDRVGIPKGVFDRDFGFKKYAEYVQRVPAIFTYVNNQCIYTNEETIERLIDKYGLDEESVQHYLSMVFYDIRLKQYIEIRPADSMPLEYVWAYAAFIKGVFLNTEQLKKWYEQYEVTSKVIEDAKEEIQRHGFDAVIYNREVYGIIIELFEMAISNLEKEDKTYLDPLYDLVKNKGTLAEKNKK